MSRVMVKPAPARPDLDALIEAAKRFPPMTPSQRREQAISFVYGQMMDCAPHVAWEEIARRFDEIYGKS